MKKILIVALSVLSALMLQNVSADTVRADKWGFNAEDATDILQKAIDSGASTVIVPAMTASWKTRPLTLKSNQEIIVEKGAVIEALPDAYKNITDSMLNGLGVKNVILRGPGTLMMHKADYQDKARYQPSEWRHAVNLRACENIKIIGLTIRSSGGDGIYIGSRPKGSSLPEYCSNVLVDSCVIEDNHRQGISVISAENLTVRNCILNNTSGTNPMAGIDFEPNFPGERLVNCLVEKCTIENNKHYGILVVAKLSTESRPISLTFKDCKIKGGGMGICVLASYKIKNPVSGMIKFVDCTVENSADSGIVMRNFRDDGCQVVYENCRLINTAAKQPGRSQIFFNSDKQNTCNVGNVVFKDCSVTETGKARPVIMFGNTSEDVLLRNVTGTVSFNGTAIKAEEYIEKNGLNAPRASIRPLAPAKLKPLSETLGKRRKSQPRLVFRGPVKFLFYGEKGKNIEFKLGYSQISKRYKTKSFKLDVKAPSENSVTLPDAVIGSDNKFTIKAEETGTYVVSCNPKGNKLSLESSSVPYSMALDKGFMQLYRPQGRVYFRIPQGLKEFTVQVAGAGSETVSASVWIGRKMIQAQDHISAPFDFKVSRDSTSAVDGSIVFTKAVEDVNLKIPAPLNFIIAADKGELFIEK